MLKKFLLLVLLLALAVGGAVFYMGNKATEVPEWFDTDVKLNEIADNAALEETLARLGETARQILPGTDPTTPRQGSSRQPQTSSARSSGAPAPSVEEPRPAAPRTPTRGGSAAAPARPEVALDEPQLNALLQRGLDARPQGRRVRQATKVIQANLLEDRMAVGGVTNVEKLMSVAESERERAVVRRLTRLAPFIQGRDFYVGVEGRPVARNGKLAFDGLTLKIGQLSFDPHELAERFGLEDRLAKQEMAVALPDLPLGDVRIVDEQLLLTLAR